MTTSERIENPRAALYRLLAEPFEFPVRGRAALFTGVDWGSRVRPHLDTLDLPWPTGLQLNADFESFEVEFIGLFEVGLGGAPCPLHGGYYARDRMRNLEEVVRFYDYFEYRPANTPDRYHDHLIFQLEFMAHLVRLEDSTDPDAVSVRLAQRDFLGRHLTKWIPLLHRSVESKATIPFMGDVVGLIERFTSRELALLEEDVTEAQNA